MTTPSIVDFFEAHVTTQAENYRTAKERLDSEGSGGNRRTVSNAAAEAVGNPEGIKEFSERIVARIAKEANGGADGTPNPQALLVYWNSLNSVFDGGMGKAVEAYVTAEVAKLKGQAGPKLSDEDRAAARAQQTEAVQMLDAAKAMLTLTVTQGGEDAERASRLLAEIEALNAKAPRKSNGPSGPRLGGKFEFKENGVTVADSLRKLADVHGIQQVDLKLSIATQNLSEDEAGDEEVVKGWFKNPPTRFEFTLTDAKNVEHSYVAVQSEDSPEEDEEENSDS